MSSEHIKYIEHRIAKQNFKIINCEKALACAISVKDELEYLKSNISEK